MSAPDLDLIGRFEAQLDPAHPTAGDIDVRIIGYGEISAVLRFAASEDFVFKRMAGFITDTEVAEFAAVIQEYCRALTARGIDVVPTDCHPVTTARNGRVVYLVQPAQDPKRIGNAILRNGNEDEFRVLLRSVLQAIRKVLGPPDASAGVQLGLDAQISNWAWTPTNDSERGPLYIDVGAPFLRRDGREQMNFAALARIFPGPLGWYFRRYEMRAVIDRYYDVEAVLTDLVGNFIKEGRADRVPLALEEIGAWLAGPAADLEAAPPTREAVEKYYAEDARIWTYVLAARKLDRFVKTRLLGRAYSHVLPGKIRRR